MGPKKSAPPKKAQTSPSNVENLPNTSDLRSESTKIKLSIFEIHNIPEDGRENIVNVSFMNETLLADGDTTFNQCECRSESYPISTWTLTIKEIDEQTIMDISSHPLLVSISKMGSTTPSLAALNLRMDLVGGASQPDLITYCCVDMFDLVSEEVKTIKSRAFLYAEESFDGPDIKTVPKKPYMKYALSVSKPILARKSLHEACNDPIPMNGVTMATEFIMHPPPEIFEDNIEFEVNISLPLKEGVTQTLTFKQGFRCKFTEMPCFKTRLGLAHLRGEAKFSRSRSICDLDFKDLQISPDCHLPQHLVRNYSQLISLNEVYHFKQFSSVVENILQTQEIPVEVVAKKQSEVLRFAGVIDLRTFNYVNQTSSRQAIPLKPVQTSSADRKGSANSPKSTEEPKPPKVEKDKTKGKRKSKSNIEKVVSQGPNVEHEEELPNPYAICEDGYTTCLVLSIMLDRPLVPMKYEVLSQEEIKIANCEMVFNEICLPMLKKDTLNSIFKSQILKFATHKDLKAYHKCKQRELFPMNDIWSIAENDFFGSCALQIASKYNFNTPLEDDELEVLLKNSYIHLVNKAYDVLNEKGNSEEQKEALIKFRLQCAEECRELGYKSAKDFHIMNLKDTACSSRSLIDYALFNLRIGDEAMAMECALDAVTKDPEFYDAYLLQAYIYHMKRDRKTCDSTLQYATKACPNFLEAWVALYLIHAEDADGDEVEFILCQIETALKFPYIGHLHKQECIFWPAECSSEFLVGAMSNFINWGCIGFAEIALGLSVYKLGTNHYHYIIHQAVIHYVRGRYLDALHVLKQINTNCNHKLLKIKRLAAHCLLSLKNNEVVTLMDVLAPNCYENKVYTPRCNLLNLKLAKYYHETGKYRDGRYYLKKCCKKSGTYVSLMELGSSCIKTRSFETAIKCFKLAQKINPYDWCPWAHLALVYFRSGLKEQYKICAKEARMNKITDEIISRELDKIDETISD